MRNYAANAKGSHGLAAADLALNAVLRTNGLYYGKHITHEELAAATSYSQLKSKDRLREFTTMIDPPVYGNAAYLGSWFGLGPFYLRQLHEKFYCVDRDAQAHLAAQVFLTECPACVPSWEDAVDIKPEWYEFNRVRTVYNTSVEHFTEAANNTWISRAMVASSVSHIIVQSTNMDDSDHVFRFNSQEDWTQWLSSYVKSNWDVKWAEPVDLKYGVERYMGALVRRPNHYAIQGKITVSNNPQST